YLVALIFVVFGAPDLAMTQIMIETLSLILFVLVIRKMPELKKRSSCTARARDAILSLAGGLVVFFAVFVSLQVERSDALTQFFAASSYIEAHGRNVVNVILVDFRALDTLGEITVLSIAALGVYALL